MKRRLITEKINERNLLLVVDMLRKAEKPEDIIKALVEKHGMSKKRAHFVYKQAIKKVEDVVVSQAREYKAVLIDRLEEQYRQTYTIEDETKRLKLQRELVESMARISGVGKAPNSAGNIFSHFPETDDKNENVV